MKQANAAELRAKLEMLYEQQYFGPGCFRASGHPCGPDRLTIKPPGSKTEVFQPPMHTRVGPKYGEKRRVVFVGINPNAWAEKGLTEGESIKQFENYLAPGNPDKWQDKGFRSGLTRMADRAVGAESDEESLPFVAWTNLIKCASKDDRGYPSYRMQTFCAPKVWPELELLKPQLIICLGNLVHESLTRGAAQRGSRVAIPAAPWSEFWSEVEIAGQSVGLFNAFHPSDQRSPNSAWAAIRDGKKPKNQRIQDFLEKVTNSGSAAVWRKQIHDEKTQDDGNHLLEFIERRFLSSPSPIPVEAQRLP